MTGHCTPSRETPASMARMMIGKQLVGCERGQATAVGEVRLSLRLSRPAPHAFGTALHEVSLDVKAGEIVGIAGVSGNGQQELLRAISGEAPLPTGSSCMVCLVGKPVGHLGSAARRARGLGFVPEERLGRGAVPGMSLADNFLLTAHRQGLLRHGLIRREAVREFAQRCIDRFNVKCSGAQAPANSLSGGNLQKFIVGRELLQQPRVLVAAQPTWGVDVGAAAFIRQQLVALRDAGAAVLVVSEELEELFEVCDRIAVIANGRLSPAVPTQQTDAQTIGLWMSGMWPEGGAAAAAACATSGSEEEVRHVA